MRRSSSKRTQRSAPVGRPRAPRKTGERATLSLRITASLFEKLDADAKAKGKALSNEAEARLESTFEDQHRARLFADFYFGRELSVLLEIIGRALRDAGVHGADLSAKSGLGPPNWIDNPYGFAVAVSALMRVIEAVRPPGEIKAPAPRIPAEAKLGEAIANGLLNAIVHEAKPPDFMEQWAAGIRTRLGPLRDRLAAFDYDVAAQSALLPTSATPGVLIYDTDDPSLLEDRKEGKR